MNQPGWLMECPQVFSRGQLACQAVGPTLFGAAPGAGKVGTASVDEVKVQVRWLKGRNPWTLIDGIDGLSGPIFSSNCHVFFFGGGCFWIRLQMVDFCSVFCPWCSLCPEKWHPCHTALRLLLRWIAPSIHWQHFGPGAGLTFGESQGRHPRNLAS